MAMIQILSKRGELLEYPVVEDIETIWTMISEDEFNKRVPLYLKLTDQKTNKPIIIQTRYIYFIK